jgi:AraC family transcriptional regulator of adaptative response / DNA-3-methyladenine glycosylase II
VRVTLAEPVPLVSLVERLRRLFDLEADPAAIDERLAADPLLAPALAAHPGLRVPGARDGFELAVRAILGQQVSVRGATTLAGRLVERFGSPFSGGANGSDGAGATLDRLFPRPERLARARLETIGLPRARAGAIRALARAVSSGDLALDGSADPDETRAALQALPGVGPWTAAYVAMRALREPDAFPSEDLGLRRALAGTAGLPSPRALCERAEAWRPWRAYGALHLWQLGSDLAAELGSDLGSGLRSDLAAGSADGEVTGNGAASRASKARLRAAPHA